MTTRLIDKFQLPRKGLINIVGAGGKTSLMFCLAREISDSGKTVLTTTTTKIFLPKKDQSTCTVLADSFDELVKKSKAQLYKCDHFSAGSSHDPKTGKVSGFTPKIIDQLFKADLFDWIIVEADGARHKPIKATAFHEPVTSRMATHLILVTGLDAVGKILDSQNVHRPEIFSKNTGLSMGKVMDEKSIATSIAIEMEKASDRLQSSLNFVFLNKADTKERKNSGKKISDILQTNDTIYQFFTTSLKDNITISNRFDHEQKQDFT